jgi:hypothetical protein
MTRSDTTDNSQEKPRSPSRKRTTTNKRTAGTKASKQPAIILRHVRLRAADIALTDTLAQEREIPWSDLARHIYELGCKFVAASGPPDEHGYYGTLTGERLAQLLAADVEALILFQMRQGVVPTVIQVLLDLLQKQGVAPASILSPQVKEPANSSVPEINEVFREVSEGAVATLDIFFQGT